MNNQPQPQPSKPKRVQINFKDPSLTKQSFRAGSTIDAVLKKYAALGVSAPQTLNIFAAGIASQPYGIQRARDYQTELNSVIRVQQYFASLPATTRDRFQNDPLTMLNWLADERNHEEGRKLKLLPELAADGPAGASTAKPSDAPPPPPNSGTAKS